MYQLLFGASENPPTGPAAVILKRLSLVSDDDLYTPMYARLAFVTPATISELEVTKLYGQHSVGTGKNMMALSELP